jgi:hypothetical protein
MVLEDGDGDFKFEDARLDKRSSKILEGFLKNPSRSVNGSFNGWHETKACYRFFENDKVRAKDLLKPHQDASLSRIKNHDTILLVQDTTIVNYSHRSKPIDGLGKLKYDNEQGFLMHPTIAFSSSGLCLGTIDNQMLTREVLLGKKERQKSRPIEEKESIRWINSYHKTQELGKSHPDKVFINISDREGDFYELLQEYDATKAANAHLLVRAKSDRTIEDQEGNSSKLWSEVMKEEVSCVLEFDISSIRIHNDKKKLRESRNVKQEVRVKTVTLNPPRKVKQWKNGKPIKLTAILCSEVNHPTNINEKIEWLLLTTLEVGDNITVEEIINYYVLRWQIEIFFKVLKSGCKIEELQFETFDKLAKCITLYMIVAWRILFLTRLGRDCPDMLCDIVYDEIEWKAAYAIAYKKQPPDTPPTIGVLNKIIASFGGFLNRKSDGEPGVKVMWIGLQRLRDFSTAYQIYHTIK